MVFGLLKKNEMRRTIIVFVALCFIASCRSKKATPENYIVKVEKETNYIPYFLKVYEADSLYLVKDYQKSYVILESLFKKFKPLNTEQYKEYETYVACAYAINAKLKFKDTILKSIENYGSNSRYFKYDSVMNLAFKNSGITDGEILNATQTYRKKLNFTLRDSIQKMVEMDQVVRKDVIDFDKMRVVDSINQIKLENILNKYGFPHEKLIGEFYLDSVFTDLGTIFLHTNKDFRSNILLPKILNAVKNGFTYPENYSQSYDRMLENTQGIQLYGSYTLTKNLKDIVLIDALKIDSIRSSIGLPSRTYKRWRFKIKYELLQKRED